MVSRRRILSKSRDNLNVSGGGGERNKSGGLDRTMAMSTHNLTTFGGGGGGIVDVRTQSKQYQTMMMMNRSRDNLMMLSKNQQSHLDEEDVWYSKSKLYKDHILEVLGKWKSIDDEIWAKIIVLERNRRVAKAYARAPVLTINGGEDGFDGFRIGVNGFDNPMRDSKTELMKSKIGNGCKLKMDEAGNILIKRLSPTSNIYVKNTMQDNAVSNDILKLPSSALEPHTPYKLFDMNKFQQNVSREIKRTYPDRAKLEGQCISSVAYVKNEHDLLNSPIWVMIINIVALEMLNIKIPVSASASVFVASIGSSRHPHLDHQKMIERQQNDRIPDQGGKMICGSSDEDPYSLTPDSGGSSGSSSNQGRGSGSGKTNQTIDSSGGGTTDSGIHTTLSSSNNNKFTKNKNANTTNKNNNPQNSTNARKSRSTSRNPLSDAVKQYYGPQNWAKDQQRSYQDEFEEEFAIMQLNSKNKRFSSSNLLSTNNNDDPYYCGFRARIPNFVSARTNQTENNATKLKKTTVMTTNHNNNMSVEKKVIGGTNNLRKKLLSPKGQQQQGSNGLSQSPPSRSVPNLTQFSTVGGGGGSAAALHPTQNQYGMWPWHNHYAMNSTMPGGGVTTGGYSVQNPSSYYPHGAHLNGAGQPTTNNVPPSMSNNTMFNPRRTSNNQQQRSMINNHRNSYSLLHQQQQQLPMFQLGWD